MLVFSCLVDTHITCSVRKGFYPRISLVFQRTITNAPNKGQRWALRRRLAENQYRPHSIASTEKGGSISHLYYGPKLLGSLGIGSKRERLWKTIRAPYYLAFKDGTHTEHAARSGFPRISTKMKVWLQIISTPTADTPGTAVLLHFDQRRYLIGNAAEGTQRAAVQRKLGLIKMGDVFMTGPMGWNTAGGLLGMVLTLADGVASSTAAIAAEAKRKQKRRNATEEADVKIERQTLNLHGGKNLAHLLATARRFIFRKGMPLQINEFRSRDTPRKDWAPAWQDDLIKVWDMVIDPEEPGLSPRKRSHDEFSEAVPASAPIEEDRDDQIVKSVVGDMFDSNWRLDAFVERKLSEVVLPATIFIRKEGKMEQYHGPMPEEGVDVPDVDVLIRNPWPGALVETLPPTKPSRSSVCYIIKGHPRRGKFDSKKARGLGVKPGPDNRRLVAGESVTTEEGTVVTPEMVLGATQEGSGFAVIELPTASYIAPLITREEWSSEEVMSGISLVIWNLGPGVASDERLRNFMQKHNKLKHVVSSKDCCPNYLSLESPAAAAIRLHHVDPARFPIPRFSNVVENPLGGELPFEKARAGLTFDLEPRFLRREEHIVPVLDTAQVVHEARNNTAVVDLAKAAQAETTSPEYQAKLDEEQKGIPSLDAEVVALGTGSALPSKYRNVSATLLRVPGFGSYLLDCGENTLGQLKRVFGGELPEVLRDLKAIWISHLHADHHLGTTSVIKEWHAETMKDEQTKDNKLYVISHGGMISWVEEYSSVEDFGIERVGTITIAHQGQRTFEYRSKLSPEQQQQTGLESIQACQVNHCHGATAVVLNFANGFKVAYSGDCRPSNDFIDIGQNATLLIHEATFDDELRGDAYAKKHCTTGEALEVGRKMNAKRIMLTHFSQRYQKIPVFEKDQVAIVAFDYMRVKLGDFAKVCAFRPALMKLYEENVKMLVGEGRN
ncbi:hypothetical protein BJ875DRAFT_465985 [Amylocarpus encephaloides]|uniref:ribonuclease Z n=1 Tax=Amylocarpus encephaloides TaxID=45428 RepID=A0A9P7YG29_9HELO|nr:hypothetical protein BJ875DRAFT_465985 [Amylocarpus encephaloides]